MTDKSKAFFDQLRETDRYVHELRACVERAETNGTLTAMYRRYVIGEAADPYILTIGVSREIAEPADIPLEKITPPWTQDQVDMLNAAQKSGYLHPFTCPGDSVGCGAMDEQRDLIATPDGWVCVCGRYRQEWAFDIPPELLGKLPRP